MRSKIEKLTIALWYWIIAFFFFFCRITEFKFVIILMQDAISILFTFLKFLNLPARSFEPSVTFFTDKIYYDMCSYIKSIRMISMVLLVVVYIALATLSSIFSHQITRYFSPRYDLGERTLRNFILVVISTIKRFPNRGECVRSNV